LILFYKGVVQLYNQRALCNADQSYWDNILVNDLGKTSVLQVKPSEQCRKL